MVGQCFLLGFRGANIPHWLKEFADSYGLGGVILFDFNCQTKTYENNIYVPSQVRDLCAEIAALPSHPLLFVDQEGGRVRRLKDVRGFAPLPSQQNFNLLSETEKRRVITESFMELRRLGFHYNLAPVIDLDLNPLNPDIGAIGRSYSADADEVRANVEIVNEAAMNTGVGLSLKHFPGLGGARTNTHHDLTDISDSISEEQLKLFYDLGGWISGASMVVSHAIVQQWEKDTPVSMSPIGIGKLREHLPNILLISDDLQMQGLQKKYTTLDACLRGLLAGLDMLCIGNNLMPEDERALSHAEAISKLMTTDDALATRISLACARVTNTKAQFTRT